MAAQPSGNITWIRKNGRWKGKANISFWHFCPRVLLFVSLELQGCCRVLALPPTRITRRVLCVIVGVYYSNLLATQRRRLRLIPHQHNSPSWIMCTQKPFGRTNLFGMSFIETLKSLWVLKGDFITDEKPYHTQFCNSCSFLALIMMQTLLQGSSSQMRLFFPLVSPLCPWPPLPQHRRGDVIDSG